MLYKILSWTIFFTLWQGTVLPAQNVPMLPESGSSNNKGKAILLHLGAGFQVPGGDLAQRFGNGGQLSGALEWLSANNLIAGVTGYFSFAQKVKEDPLDMLRTAEGDIISNDRLVATVSLRERGYSLIGMVGKLWPVGDGRRAGLRVTLGAGMTRHWIRIQDDSQKVTQLTGDYRKGYDRLTGGLALHQFIGWQSLSGSRRVNWLVGVDLQQGLTRSLRDWDFASMGPITGRRADLRWGVRIGWTLPFYAQKAEQIYY